MTSPLLMESNMFDESETQMIFFSLSIPIAIVFSCWSLFTIAIRRMVGLVSLLPSISTIVASFPWISMPWFPSLVLTPKSLTFAFWDIIFGRRDSSFPHNTTLVSLSSFPFKVILTAFPGSPRRLVNSIVLILPSIFPEIIKLFWFSLISLTPIVMASIERILLSWLVGSMSEPEPIFIAGLPLRSSFT